MIYRVLGLFIIMLITLPLYAETRKAAVAGSFYPQEKSELNQTVVGLLDSVKPKEKTSDIIKAIVVPHAGYFYSGKIAAQAYQHVAHLQPRRIIVLGPSHFVSIGENVALPDHSYWQTPLGKIEIDDELRNQLLKENPFVQINNTAHVKEHAIEVQLPFIQTLFPQAKVLPIAINSLDRAKDLARILIKYADQDTLIITSTDMSHYQNASAAQAMDETTIHNLLNQDIDALRAGLTEGTMEMCGQAAVMTLIELVKLMGAIDITRLDYQHSGAVSEDQNRVVGYFSAVLIRQQLYQNLLTYAHEVLDYHVKTGKKDAPPLDLEHQFYDDPMAIFVTLRLPAKTGQMEGDLRGCIGVTSAKYPLKEAVRRYTMASATEDSRFNPVTEAELPDIQIELSLLLPPKAVGSFEDIRFGEHGVIVSQEAKAGLFLPEVSESFATREEFLSELCRQKAGLAPDCYQDPKTQLQVFETIHFR